MKNQTAVDIIVPVWNRPVETRNCLVNLFNYTSDFRIIMVDNGSDRETEKMLQEFSEGLDDRALLLRNDLNVGLVKALNRGLSKGESEFFVILRNTSLVGPGWLEPLLEFCRRKPQAGLVVPHLTVTGSGNGRAGTSQPCEVSHGSFAAMLIRKAVYDAVGGFDEEMDGGVWCLRDYSRRACKSGFLTFIAPQVTVQYVEEVQLGSEVRRRENLERTVTEFRRRWGTESCYCVVFPKGAEPAAAMQKLELLLPGARQGWKFDVVLHHHLHRELVKAGMECLHENIRLHPVPFFHTSATVNKIIARITRESPETEVVAGIDGVAVQGYGSPLSFGALEDRIRRCND